MPPKQNAKDTKGNTEPETPPASTPAVPKPGCPIQQKIIILESQDQFKQWAKSIRLNLQVTNEWNPAEKEPRNTANSAALIWNTVGADLRYLIEDEDTETAPDMFIALKELCLSTDVNAQLTSINGLISFNFAMNREQDRKQIKNIMTNLEAAYPTGTITISDLAAIVLINAIPNQFAPTRVMLSKEQELVDLTPKAIMGYLGPEFDKYGTKSKAPAIALSAATKSTIPKCEHGFHTPGQCWKCHPEQRPTCEECKALGHEHYRHGPNSKKHKENLASRANLATTNEQTASTEWIIDSGSTDQMCGNKDAFDLYSTFHDQVSCANGTSMPVVGKGTIPFVSTSGQSYTIRDVLYCPNLKHNLLSVPKLCRNGFTVAFEGNKVSIMKDNQHVLDGTLRGNLFYISITPKTHNNSDPKASFMVSSSSIMDWHRRLGHLNEPAMRKLEQHNMLVDFSLPKEQLGDCEACLLGKSRRQPFFGSGQSRASRIGELIHWDLCEVSPKTHDGYGYFCTFSDDFSNACWEFKFKNKSDFFTIFKPFAMYVYNHTGRHVSILRSDNELERNNELQEFLREHGIQQQLTHYHSPNSNGKSERQNDTLLAPARALLIDTEPRFPLNYWGEAVSLTCYTRNRSPTSGNDKHPDTANKTPYEIWNKGRKPTAANLRIFGEPAYVHILKPYRDSKVEPRAIKARFVGYSKNRKGFRLVTDDGEFIESRDVRFLKVRFQPIVNNNTPTESEELTVTYSEPADSIQENQEPEQPVIPDPVPAHYHRTLITTDNIVEGSRRQANAAVTKQDENLNDWWSQTRNSLMASTHTTKTALLTMNHPSPNGTKLTSSLTDDPEPQTLAAALKRPDSDKWWQGVLSEWNSILSNHVWKLVPRPRDRKVIGVRWVFKRKRNENNEIVRYKARLTAKGYDQVEGIDYTETYAPVASATSLRLVLSIAASEDWEIDQGDIGTAFLLGTLDEEIYLEQAEGFVVEGKEDWVYKLEKSIYGLKQSPRVFNQHMDKQLRSLGFIPCPEDPCIYSKPETSGRPSCIIYLYVDDLLFCGPRGEINKIKEQLGKLVPLSDLGPARYIVGLEMRRDRTQKTLVLHQHGAIAQLLLDTNMEFCHPSNVPASPSVHLSKSMCPQNEEDKTAMAKVPFRQTLGALIHISNHTRPDIAQAVSSLCRFSNNPGQDHWHALKLILRYLKGTSTMGITLGGESLELNLVAYADADWAGDIDTRRSKSGYIFTIGQYPISWRSKLQISASLSSMEAELVAISDANREVLWLRKFLTALGYRQKSATIINEDNQSCIKYVYGTKNISKAKHIAVKHYHIKETIEDGQVKVIYCPSDKNIADIFTKPLHSPTFLRLRDMLKMTAMFTTRVHVESPKRSAPLYENASLVSHLIN